jgi:hypothetical protein
MLGLELKLDCTQDMGKGQQKVPVVLMMSVDRFVCESLLVLGIV